MRTTKSHFQVFVLLIAFAISSCEKEEKPIEPHAAGDSLVSSVSLGSLYKNQAFFDLETDLLVAENNRNHWDLAFECGAAGYHIVLNAAKYMSLAHTGETSFAAVTDTTGYEFTYDTPNGDFDSTAFGEWVGNNEVFILNRGQDHLGNHQGFRKIVLHSVDATKYIIEHANLDGSDLDVDTVFKNESYNFTFVSCEYGSEGPINVEPPKEDWDLVFTQYTHIFYDHNPVETYLVTGVLLNRNKVEVAEVFDKGYEEITYDDIADYEFSNNIDGIGYDWKYYDFDASEYLVLSEMNFIIKSTEGYYFKLHFIDFYDQNGNKGTPVFEFAKL